jgi:hypothetical protein
MEPAFTLDQQGFKPLSAAEVREEFGTSYLILLDREGGVYCRDIRFGERAGDVKARYLDRGWTDDSCIQLDLNL